LITNSENQKIPSIIDLATGHSGNGETDIIEELAPLPVTFKVDGVGKSMIICSWDIVLRGRVTGNDDKTVLFIVDSTTNFLIL